MRDTDNGLFFLSLGAKKVLTFDYIILLMQYGLLLLISTLKACSRLMATSYAWFTFSSRVLVKTFGEMWTRQSPHECKHSHFRARIVDNETRYSRHFCYLWLRTDLPKGLIYWHVSESFEMRQEQIKSVEDETNVTFTLSFSSCLVLSQRKCKPGISDIWAIGMVQLLWIPTPTCVILIRNLPFLNITLCLPFLPL